jgi:hypothetical protein
MVAVSPFTGSLDTLWGCADGTQPPELSVGNDAMMALSTAGAGDRMAAALASLAQLRLAPTKDERSRQLGAAAPDVRLL